MRGTTLKITTQKVKMDKGCPIHLFVYFSSTPFGVERKKCKQHYVLQQLMIRSVFNEGSGIL